MKRNNPKYQEKEKEFQETAIYLTNSIKEADEVSESEIEASYATILSELQKDKRRTLVRSLYWKVSSTAAVLIAALGLSWWLLTYKDVSVQLSATLLDETNMIHTDEVTLINGNNTIHLKDSADIHYQSNGSSNVAMYQLNPQMASKESPEKDEVEELNQIIVPQGKRATVTLSDGTRIYINSGTKLIYPKVFDKKNRREVLLEGEAYLAVAKNENCPFIVHTKGFDVHVLGTEFNVFARQEEEEASVVLVNGHVEVTTSPKTKIFLNPNQRVKIDKEYTKVEDVNVLEYVSWKDNMLYLKDRRAKEIFDYLKFHYGYKIEYEPLIAAYSLTGKLDLQDNIEDIMKTISLLLKVNYRIKDKTIYIYK